MSGASSAGDEALGRVGQQRADLVERAALVRQQRVGLLQGVVRQPLPHGAHLRQQIGQGGAEPRLVAGLDRALKPAVETVEQGEVRVVDGVLALPEHPDDHGLSSGAGAAAGAAGAASAAGAAAPPSIASGALPAPISPLSRDSSSSTSLLLDIRSSSAVMSSLAVPDASSRAPLASSSSMAPARACIARVLSSARWTARPTSPIS